MDRERLSAWLQSHPLIPLSPLANAESVAEKAGLVAFSYNPERRPHFRYLLIKPTSKKPDLGPPKLQLPKGTRMALVNIEGKERWQDVNKTTAEFLRLETTAETALREAHEEAGVMLENITRFFDCGLLRMRSSTTNQPKPLHLYAAECIDEGHLLPLDQLDGVSERRWLGLGQAEKDTREDHLHLLEVVQQELMTYYASEKTS